MKKSDMLRRLKLNQDSFDKIKEAVKEAEKNTTGEIALAVTAESARYSVYELMYSLIFGLLAFVVMLPCADFFQRVLDKWFWGASSWHMPAFYGVTCFGLVALLFWIANLPVVDRLIIPKMIRKQTVFNRALRYFVESGVYATQNRSGILIFVSYMEREVRIIADSGINQKISSDLWNLIAADLAEGLGTNDATGAFVKAIERCGQLLKEHFPLSSETMDNPDELVNGLVVLEDAEWM
ncbi:MAG: TPM domain-containing protein [Spirochaetaceae bacterium]|nr:TPM domain-containing protein [Spirochaetaceae bacterium]